MSRVFRSGFPDFERSNFRTASWWAGTEAGGNRKDATPLHPTLLHAFGVASSLEQRVGLTILPEREGGAVARRSYRELHDEARRVAGGLRALGVRPRDRVLVILPTSHEFVTTFFAIQMLGAIPVPAYPPAGFRLEAGLERLAHVAVHATPEVCVTWKEAHAVMGELALRAPSLRHVVTAAELAAAAPDEEREATPDELAFLQYTSGSTGQPKGVALSHRNILANVHAIGLGLRITRKDVGVGWCPLYHDMGLIGQVLFSIYWRIPLVLLSPTAFLARPHRWLWAIHEHRGTLSPAPCFGYAMAVRRTKPEQRKGLDLSSWRIALNGAEPVSLGIVEEFERTYAPHGYRPTAMLPVYGLAESSLAVTIPKLGSRVRAEVVSREELANGRAVPAVTGAVTVVSVGRPVAGQRVLVVDESGLELPEREVGHIVTSGDSVMGGYFQDADATEKVLRDGWLWTGDLGYFSGGELFITGRAKDVIMLRGRNYYAEDLEQSAERLRGVRPGGCVAFGVYDEASAGEHLVLVCETQLDDQAERLELVEKISAAVLAEAGLLVEQVVLVDPGTIPKTSSGKRQRSQCRQLYLRDQLFRSQTGRLRKGVVFMRSQAGFLLMHIRKLVGRQQPPQE